MEANTAYKKRKRWRNAEIISIIHLKKLDKNLIFLRCIFLYVFKKIVVTFYYDKIL